MTHPGHPVFSASDLLSDSRPVLNEALYTVKTHSTAVALTNVHVETHGTHILVDCTSGALTMTLPDPTAAPHVHARFVIKKVDSTGNAVTIATNGSETIDGSATASLASQWDSLTVWNDGTNWYTE